MGYLCSHTYTTCGSCLRSHLLFTATAIPAIPHAPPYHYCCRSRIAYLPAALLPICLLRFRGLRMPPLDFCTGSCRCHTVHLLVANRLPFYCTCALGFLLPWLFCYYLQRNSCHNWMPPDWFLWIRFPRFLPCHHTAITGFLPLVLPFHQPFLAGFAACLALRIPPVSFSLPAPAGSWHAPANTAPYEHIPLRLPPHHTSFVRSAAPPPRFQHHYRSACVSFHLPTPPAGFLRSFWIAAFCRFRFCLHPPACWIILVSVHLLSTFCHLRLHSLRTCSTYLFCRF